jgi:protein-disulfide isomerase
MATKKERREQARQERLRREADDAAKQRRQRMIQLGAVAVFGAAIVIVALIVLSQSGSDDPGGDTALEGTAAIDAQLRGIDQDGLSLGDTDAPVTVSEFGDLQCPVCKAFSEQVLPDLIDEEVRNGDARLDFKALTFIGPQSEDAALAALAAGEQGRYWSFIELFYRNQGQENSGYVTDEFLEEVARGAGVEDIERWNADRADPALQDQLTAASDEASELGINSTPTFHVEGPGGSRTLTAPTLDQLRAAIGDASGDA